MIFYYQKHNVENGFGGPDLVDHHGWTWTRGGQDSFRGPWMPEHLLHEDD